MVLQMQKQLNITLYLEIMFDIPFGVPNSFILDVSSSILNRL